MPTVPLCLASHASVAASSFPSHPSSFRLISKGKGRPFWNEARQLRCHGWILLVLGSETQLSLPASNPWTWEIGKQATDVQGSGKAAELILGLLGDWARAHRSFFCLWLGSNFPRPSAQEQLLASSPNPLTPYSTFLRAPNRSIRGCGAGPGRGLEENPETVAIQPKSL